MKNIKVYGILGFWDERELMLTNLGKFSPEIYLFFFVQILNSCFKDLDILVIQTLSPPPPTISLLVICQEVPSSIQKEKKIFTEAFIFLLQSEATSVFVNYRDFHYGWENTDACRHTLQFQIGNMPFARQVQ